MAHEHTDNLIGVGGGASGASPLAADNKPAVRKARRDSDISLDDPSQTASKHHLNYPTNLSPENHEDNEDDGYDGDTAAPPKLNTSDKTIYSSPMEDLSPAMPVSDPSLTPISTDMTQTWLDDQTNNRMFRALSEARTVIPASGGLSTVDETAELAQPGRAARTPSEDGAIVEDPGHIGITANHIGLQTPKTGTLESVTPIASVRGYSENTQSAGPSVSGGTSMEETADSDEQFSSPSDASMPDLQASIEPEATRASSLAETGRRPGSMRRGNRGHPRHLRYVAQRGSGQRQDSELMSQYGRTPTIGEPNEATHKDEETMEG
ncbi:hypothetical protein HJFPF1_00267 [Paramyrothecium foliicola]|nr:hypothetical protein HJFPF1_00267 [Paramyrothecium foliicola]